MSLEKFWRSDAFLPAILLIMSLAALVVMIMIAPEDTNWNKNMNALSHGLLIGLLIK